MEKEKFDALVILGGGLKKENGKWRTTNFDEGDTFGVAGDRVRVVAGYFLFTNGHSDLIVASGGRGQYKNIPDCPTLSEVIKKELITLGVPDANIMEENKSGNTYEQLKFIKSLIENRGIKKVGIISNEWHLPRIEAMIQYGPDLDGLGRSVKLISGEEVVLKYDSAKWKDIIKKAYASEEMKKRIAIEQTGVLDIKTGKYKF